MCSHGCKQSWKRRTRTPANLQMLKEPELNNFEAYVILHPVILLTTGDNGNQIGFHPHFHCQTTPTPQPKSSRAQFKLKALAGCSPRKRNCPLSPLHPSYIPPKPSYDPVDPHPKTPDQGCEARLVEAKQGWVRNWNLLGGSSLPPCTKPPINRNGPRFWLL